MSTLPLHLQKLTCPCGRFWINNLGWGWDLPKKKVELQYKALHLGTMTWLYHAVLHPLKKIEMTGGGLTPVLKID